MFQFLARNLCSYVQQLEIRRCMASAWTNPMLPLDVDGSGRATALDALIVINRLDDEIDRKQSDNRPPGTGYFVDANGDDQLTAQDALLVINALAKYTEAPSLVVGIEPSSDPDGNGVVLEESITFVGQSNTDWRVELFADDGTLLQTAVPDDEKGLYSLTVNVERGVHDLEIAAVNPLGQRTSTTRRIRVGDPSINWNATALNVVREWTTTSDDPYEGRIVPSEPPRVARNLAMIHTAMFDAIATIDGGYQTYLNTSEPPPNASPMAAGISAAFTVSTALYPDADSMAMWLAARDESLRSIPDGRAKEDGVRFGEVVGLQMLADRLDDGSTESKLYAHGDQSGNWQRTFPGYLPPLLPHWDDVRPFAVEDVRDYRPVAPPLLESETYADSVDEVMRLGAVNSETRTDDQTEIAVFWADGAGTFTPPGHWNQIAADVMIQQGTSPIETARTFAMLNLALADAGIAAWDAKYHYDFWRPIDAIQRADEDGNDGTNQDVDWRPLLLNPPFPTYTSGHSTFSGAADAVLTAIFGSEVAFESQIDAFASPGQRPLDPRLIITRSFTSFTEAAEEAGLSRIYGGIHFDFDNTAGLESGRAIGSTVVATQFARKIFPSPNSNTPE